jgi:RimJ/RimL family protein N-acetyltransferase
MNAPPSGEKPRPGTFVSGAPVLPLPPGLFPPRIALEGTSVRLEPLDPAIHACDLYAASHGDENARAVWTWLAAGPFAEASAFEAWLRDGAAAADPVFYAVRDGASGRASGVTSFMRIAASDGVLEIGNIWFAPSLQRTSASTEALVLMLRHAFDDLGCRRVEWKCNALNEPSRRAALRLGFRFEGIFFRHMIVKGCNRDTAWYAMLAEEWPERRAAFAEWLAAENFDADGRQRRQLARPAVDALTTAAAAP